MKQKLQKHLLKELKHSFMQVTKSYGTSGEVVISLNGNDPRDFEIEEPLFITFDGLEVPFFIEKIEVKGNRAIVKLEDIDSYDDAEEIVGKQISLENDETDDDMPQLIGMNVIDQKGVSLGIITGFDNFSGNTCITIDHNGSDVMLPINDELIIDVTDNSIILTVPEGLL